MGNNINKPRKNKGKNIKQPDDKYNNMNYPVFCFKHLSKKYHLDYCTDSEKKCLMEQLVLLSSMTWNEIQLASKHGTGSEKIELSSLKDTQIPISFTDDVGHLLALRFDGKKPIVGFRNGFIFHVFFIDRDFTLYNH